MSLKGLARRVLPGAVNAQVALNTENSALRQLGWFRSRKAGMSIDAEGKPLPWYTYPAIAFLGPRIPADAAVFEFGMGNSTLWWAERAAKVAACEHDKPWFDRIVSQMPANVTPIFADVESDAYPHAAVARGEPFDILAIDGRRRTECCLTSLPLLTERGIVLWDNAEREKYAEGCKALEVKGFRRLDFWGMGPINTNVSLSSIFYRPGNLLGI